MNIVIRNYLSGSFTLESEPKKWDAIVILDPALVHSDFVAQHAKRFLYLRFDDVEGNFQGKRAPTTNDLRAAIEFAKQSENLLVCCRAGQSRSAATAFLICHTLCGADAACELLDPKRHIPNALIIELGARLTEDDSVRQTFHKWQVDHKNIKLNDYYNDIESEFDELEAKGARNRIVK